MMKELTLQECREIEGGVSWSTVLTGAGVALIGVACMVSAPSVAIAVGGYAAYNIGAIGTILGACDL